MHRVGKTTMAKKLGEERGISVHEAERRLDAKLFLDEISKWKPVGLNHLFLFQKMFAHMKAIELKVYHCGNHRSHWQPLLERDLWAKVSAMEMLTPETTQDEVMALYQEVYQLKRNPGEVPCLEDTAKEIQIEISDMLRECLWCKWGPAQLEELRWRTPRCLLKWNSTPRCRWHVTILVTSRTDSKSPRRRP